MDDLARHIRQAHDDVEQVQTSSKKITSRFKKIEAVELVNAGSSTEPVEQLLEEQ